MVWSVWSVSSHGLFRALVWSVGQLLGRYGYVGGLVGMAGPLVGCVSCWSTGRSVGLVGMAHCWVGRIGLLSWLIALVRRLAR